MSVIAAQPRMPAAVYASSRTDEWATPQRLFDRLDVEFGFDLDVCATFRNAKCRRFYDRDADGLAQPWLGVCWCNPPYGREIVRWVRKAAESARAGATVVCLVPARTDAAWWHDYCAKAEVRFLRGRLKFGVKKDAPFPSAVVVFRTRRQRRSRTEQPLLWADAARAGTGATGGAG